MKFIVGKKIEMTQMFREDGKTEPVTLVNVPPATVSLLRSKEKDGYDAVQVRSGRVYREFRPYRPGDDITSYAVGSTIDISVFSEGEKVTISSVSKGKGFQGGMKRHGFHGAPKTHGVKHAHRQPGSIGAGGVQKVLKGQRMAGRMGQDRVTTRGVKVVKIYADNHIIALKGGIPGNRGTLVEIRA